MGDILAIVSKAVFEKAGGKTAAVGDVLGMDRYVSANKGLAPLAGGGRLYMVTVRPPNEALWLVGVLDHPAFDGAQWTAAASAAPIVDISGLRGQLTFENGKGITAAPGALGMSLQTPRVLSAADVALLDAAITAGAAAGPPPVAAPAAPRSPLDAALAAVLADPASAEARHVYADALMTSHEPRGELITIDLALAGPLGMRRRAQLAARRGELVAEHGAAWFPTPLAHRIEGGMIAALTGTANQLVKLAPALFAAHPITEVHATNVDARTLGQLAAAPWLARVRHLSLKGAVGDGGAKLLATTPGAQQLEHLNVLGCGIGAKGLAAFAGHLPRVRTLVLTANPIGDAGLGALAGWTTLHELEQLYLSSCKLTLAGVNTLIAATLPRLAKLTLSNNALGDPLAAALVGAAAHLPALRRLELQKIRATPALIGALAAPALAQLRQIDVRNNNIRAAQVAGDPRFRAA